MENGKDQFVFGDYVLTGIKNAFNDKTSWWLSKRNYTTAMYCYSTTSCNREQENRYQIRNIESYIKAFDLLVEERKV